jgi:hypothetical protein
MKINTAKLFDAIASCGFSILTFYLGVIIIGVGTGLLGIYLDPEDVRPNKWESLISLLLGFASFYLSYRFLKHGFSLIRKNVLLKC